MRIAAIPCRLILAAVGGFLLAGCAADYSFRVTADSFETASGGFDSGDPSGLLPESGEFDGIPAGDGYLTEGEVVVAGDEIQVSYIYHPEQANETGVFHMVGRPVGDDESPTSVVIRFDSVYDGILGGSSPATLFTVQDVDGDVGVAFEISGVHVAVNSGGEFFTLEFEGASENFNGATWHQVVVQINFAAHTGRITVIQGDLEGTQEFDTPANFGLFRAMKMEVDTLSHIIARPEAIFVDVEPGQNVHGCSHDAKLQNCLAWRCADRMEGLACDRAASSQSSPGRCASWCPRAGDATFRPVDLVDFELGCPRGAPQCDERPEAMKVCSHQPETRSCTFTTCFEVDGLCKHESRTVRDRAACDDFCAVRYRR